MKLLDLFCLFLDWICSIIVIWKEISKGSLLKARTEQPLKGLVFTQTLKAIPVFGWTVAL